MVSRQLHIDGVPGRNPGSRAPVWMVLAALWVGPSLCAQDLFDEASGEKLLVVPLAGQLGQKTVSATISNITAQLEREPAIAWIVLEINSTEGSHAAAITLGDFIFEELRGKTSVAYIPAGGRATGPAVIPALACREIAMGPGAVLGGGTGNNLDEDLRKKARKTVERYSERRKRSQLLAGLTITGASEAVYSLRRKNRGLQSPYVFWSQTDLNNADIPVRKNDFHDPERILQRDEIVNLDLDTAFDYGWVRYPPIEAGEDYTNLLLGMNLNLPEESIIILGKGPLVKVPLSAQGIVDFLNHPLVRFFLILGTILGFMIELQMFGTMIPGLVSITCFCLLIGGGLFPASGVPEPTTTWFEIVLFLVGIGLISIEILLVPGVAVFAILGSILCFGSLVMAVVPSTSLPGGEQLEFRDAILLITAGLGSAMILFFAVIRFLPDKLTGGMVTTSTIRGVPDADSAEESRQKNARLVGKSGLCITPLRPSGTIEIDKGERLDVVSIGEFIEKGEKVTIDECSSTRIVVSRTEPSE